MSLTHVPNVKGKTTTLRAMRSESKSSQYPFKEQWMVIKGKVEVVSKSDKTTTCMDSTEFILRLSEGAEVDTYRIDYRGKIFQRRYTVKNGTLHYKII
jgi:lipopolysaccharide export system protein LptA